MNIAILIAGLTGGGAERVAVVLGNEMLKQGHRVFYFLSTLYKQIDYEVKGTIVWCDVKETFLNVNSGIPKTYLSIWEDSRKIKKLKQKYHIDVSISFMETFNYLNILSKGNDRIYTRICTVLSKRTDLNTNLYQERTIRFFYSHADKVIVMSRYCKDEMKEIYHIPKKKIYVIPNFSSINKSSRKKAEWKYGADTIIFVGRLEPVKQVDKIIRSFSIVQREKRNAHLIILGKGWMERYLKDLVKLYHLSEHVTFIGFTDNVSFYLEHAQVFVTASKVEGFSNAMIEAMEFGLPVVASDAPGANLEIVGDYLQDDSIKSGYTLHKYGIVVHDFDDKKVRVHSEPTLCEMAFGNAILRLLNDNKLYQYYSESSLKRAKRYNKNRVMKLWTQLVEGTS